MTDCGAVSDLRGAPVHAADDVAAAAFALMNGTDIELGSTLFLENLAKAVYGGHDGLLIRTCQLWCHISHDNSSYNIPVIIIPVITRSVIMIPVMTTTVIVMAGIPIPATTIAVITITFIIIAIIIITFITIADIAIAVITVAD